MGGVTPRELRSAAIAYDENVAMADPSGRRDGDQSL
jgi:hypothetical protein